MMTLFVLRHARHSLPFAWYQFGHEIKAARFDLFFRLTRALGWELEAPVREDGTYHFESFLRWLKRLVSSGDAGQNPRSLWTDEEALQDIQRRLEAGESLSPLDIALHYTYPLKYVQEELLDKLNSQHSS